MERKLLFWARLQHEVQDAEENGAAIMIMMDGNAHLGSDYLRGDPNPCNIKINDTFEYLINTK